MKIVLHTQHRENYGAHDWDGQGECPQYWKCKGGDTYVVHGVTIAQAQDAQYWDALNNAIQTSSEYFEEYILGDLLVDDVDYVESDHVEEWDAPTNLSGVIQDGQRVFLATRLKQADFHWVDGVESSLEQWKQIGGQREEYKLMYNMKDGRTLLYKEWLAEQEAA